MKKRIIIAILLLVSLVLLADETYPFLWNYSARNVAIGYSGGIADIWASNSANSSGNPALLGYQNGVSYRFSHGDHFMTELEESVFSFGYKGVGIALPMPSYKNNFGLVHYYYFTPLLSIFFGPITDEIGYYEISRKYSLGINVMEFMSNFGNSSQKKRPFEISLGISNIENTAKYKIVTYAPQANFTTQDYGANLSVDPFQLFNLDSVFDVGISFGIQFINPAKIKYRIDIDNDLDGQLNEDPDDGIDNDGDGYVDEDDVEDKWTAFYDTRMAAAVHAELPLKKISNAPPAYFLYHFSRNFLSLTLNAETGNDYECLGGEISLLDIFYYRTGYYEEYNSENMVADLKTITSGWGVRLNYEDYISLEYNATSIDEGGFFFPFEMYEIGLNVNLMKLFEKSK